MSTEYYSLEKTAEVLGLPPAEVNRLRERSQLRAFRDGSSWKFKKVDIDNYLAETIKARSKQKSSESDFDLLGSSEEDETPTLLAESASFDALMEDGLSMDDAMVDTDAPKREHPSDGLTLADEPEGTVDLMLGDDEVVFDETGSSPKLNLAQDSGLSLLEAEVELEMVEKGGSDIGLEVDDDDILTLVDAESAENTSTMAIPIEDDFQLTPGVNVQSDDSESSSQVIALEEAGGMFGEPVEPSFPPFGAPEPMGTTPQSGDFAFGGAIPLAENADFFPASASAAFPHPTSSSEPTYGIGTIVMLLVCAFFLVICGCMSLDLIIHIWSWEEPFVINSTIMNLVAGSLK